MVGTSNQSVQSVPEMAIDVMKYVSILLGAINGGYPLVN